MLRRTRIVAALVSIAGVVAPAGTAAETIREAPPDESGHAGIVYGDGHAFIVEAPEGWVLDNSSGVEQGLHAVFYPAGSSWAGSDVVMYVNTAARDPDRTLDGFIAWEQDHFREHSPDVRITVQDEIVAEGGSRARVRHLSGDSYGNHEAIAYIEEETVFVMIVLTARSEPLFVEARRAFEDLVESYMFITTHVVPAEPSNGTERPADEPARADGVE